MGDPLGANEPLVRTNQGDSNDLGRVLGSRNLTTVRRRPQR